MPRYHFDITDAGRLMEDYHGVLLADDDEARDEALGLLPNLVRDFAPAQDKHEMIVSARNEAGAIVYEARLTLDGRWWPGRR